jgi:hypothetical protein
VTAGTIAAWERGAEPVPNPVEVRRVLDGLAADQTGGRRRSTG